MKDLRTRSAALVVALLLLLSVAGVAGAAHVILPATAALQAQEQVAKEHGEEDTDEDEDTTTEDEDATEVGDTDALDAEGAQGEHGALVSAVAQNEECVGGPNDNHGWAVSQVARGLQAPAAGECPEWVPPTLTTETTDATDVTAAPGKSGEHRKDKKAKTHGRWASQP